MYFLYKMNIKDLKIYIISNENNKKYYDRYLQIRKKLIDNEFKEKNIELFNFIESNIYETSLALTYIKIYEKILNESSSHLDFKPFIILEDDCDINNDVSFEIENYEKYNTDAIYLGISEYNAHNTLLSFDNDWKLKIRDIDHIYFQIFNMLCKYAILYCSRDFVKFLYKYIYDIYFNQKSDISFDLYLARIQNIKNIYALKNPIFYKNDISNNNKLTKINYDNLISRNTSPLITYEENILYKTFGYINYFNEPKYKNQSNDVIFVTAYFESDNKQGNNEIYYTWMKNLLQNLHQPLIIYTDYRSYKKIVELRGYLMNKTIIYLTSLDELYMSKYNNILEYHQTIDKEKHIHNINLYKIWNEKINFVKKSIDNKTFNGEYYIWIDIGFFRDKNCNTLLKHFPDIQKIKNEINEKVGILQISPISDKYSHLIHEENCQNVLTKNDLNDEICTVGGGFLIFHKNNIYKIHKLYFELMDKYIAKNRFIGKDQILYANLTITHPELFKIIIKDYNNKYELYQPDIWFYMFNHFLPVKPIVSSFIMGGLCNQLFQILMAYTYAQRNDCIYLLDSSKISENPHSNENYLHTIYKKLPIIYGLQFDTLIYEQSSLLYEYFDKVSINTIFKGYFQTEKYFEENTKFIDDIFDFDNYITQIPIDYDSVFIHLRLGDYANHPLHDIKLIDNGYYEKSIMYINNLYPNIKFKVFSNNIEQAKILLSSYSNQYNIEFVNEKNEVKSLFMMSKCYKGGIGANSSFSWFANLFNRNPNKIFILPSKWFCDSSYKIDDIYPKNCVIIDV